MSITTSSGAATVLVILILSPAVSAINFAPVWDRTVMDRIEDHFTKQIYENTTENELLGTLLATDPEGTTVTYGVDSKNTVTVDPNTGNIRLVRLLDREKGDNQVKVKFRAYDAFETGNVRNTITYDMTIDVQDVNDNAPDFLNLPYGEEVPENGPVGATVFTRVKIIDQDNGYNAEVFVNCSSFDEQSRIACETFGVSKLQQMREREYNCSIFTKKSLDYEKENSYFITLLAWDNGSPRLSSQVNIHITVKDVQDTGPEFLNTPINLYTNESAPVRSKIGEILARDGDTGNPRPVRVVMLSGTDNFELVLKPNTNNSQPIYDVITKKKLDREDLRGQATFDVMAIEYENGVSTNINTTTRVQVNIFDVNDNAPKFDRDVYYINASESVRSTDNTQIPGLTMTVRDLDDTSNARFYVTIQSQTFPGAFAVSPTNATSQGPFALAVVNADFMDYENPSYRKQQVVLVAREYATQEVFSSSATVFVTLLDVNDNSPLFNQSDYTQTVQENVGPMDITRIFATDADSGANGQITYSIDTGDQASETDEYFEINPSTGDIRLLKPVNYESNREFPLVISASDGGFPSRTTKVVLRVIILNVNDVPPVFLYGTYETTVTETATLFQPPITVQATDNEQIVQNITFRIISGNNLPNGPAFAVHPRDGRLSMTRTVNINETPNLQGFFMLVIEASDNGNPPLTSTATVKINVQDENNFDPRFDKLVYSAAVSELAARGSSVIQVNATDEDKDENGRLRYSLQGSLGDFSINPQSGLISVSQQAQLDSVRSRYRLLVVATDHGSPRQRSSTATVNVNIIDKNNKVPVFTEALYTTTVSEGNTGWLTYMYIYMWTDMADRVDAGGKPNRLVIQYTLSMLEHKIIQDRFQPLPVLGRKSIGDIYITILDTCNSLQLCPTGSENGNLVFGEGLNGMVLKVSAQDPDTNSSLVYEILPSTIRAKTPQGAEFNEPSVFNFKASFYIDGDDGEVRIQNKLSYEHVAEMDFAVQVKDVFAETSVPVQTATTSVNIRILGSVDATPRFVAPWTPEDPTYYFNIPEGTALNSLITTLVASDPIGQRSIENFREIPTVDERNYFTIDPTTGALRVNADLDYEKLTAKVLPVEVEAISHDGLKSAFARIRIQIQDINDNSPVFDKELYTFEVEENRRYPFVVGTVFASDADSGVFQKITYTLGGQGANNFEIHQDEVSNVGTVIVAFDGILDREQRAVYQLTVTATDNPGGRTQRQSSARIRITLKDENDERPQFSRPAYNLLTVDSTDIDTVIGQVEATDLDSSPNARIFYTMMCSSDLATTLFSMRLLNGEVLVRRALDGRATTYVCNVTATDSGRPPQSSTVPLLIQVRPGSDNGNPVFMWPPGRYVAENITENSPSGTEVGFIQATSIVGNVTFGFVDNSNLDVTNQFSIDPDTGRVTTLRSLDREEQVLYELPIFAQVAGNANLSTSNVLRIEIQDENDNIPVYNGKGCDEEITRVPPFKVYPQEDTPVGASIMTLRACDPDDPAKTVTNYKLVSRATDENLPTLSERCERASISRFSLFKVDSTRVSINVKEPLDHDAPGGPVHLLCIQATDAAMLVQGRRRKRQTEVYDQQNYTVAYIEVHLVDINDNKPVFPSKVAKKVILEFPQTNSLVAEMTAVDADSPPYNKVRYSIQSTVFVDVNKSTRNISIGFDIDSMTGAVTTKLTRYTQFLGGTFSLVIRAEDNLNNNFFDTATLQITVLQVGQRLRVTWNSNNAPANADLKESIQRNLQSAMTGKQWQLTVDELRYHMDNKGVSDSNKYDACFVVIDSEGRAPNKDDVFTEVRKNSALDYYDLGLCDVETSAGLGGKSSYWWVLIALAIIIFIGTLILIIVVFILAANLKKKQKYERTTLIPRPQ